jgi:hypothetical protein
LPSDHGSAISAVNCGLIGTIMSPNGWGTSGNPGVTAAPPPPPARRYRAKLASVADVNREIQRVYRECRSGLLDVSDGSKLANILSMIARIHEASNLEERITALEAQT